MLEDTYRAVTSKAVRRTLLYGVFLAVASALLYGIAVVGYIAFYRDYVPHRVRTAPLYLQYSKTSPLGAMVHRHHPQHPFAIADLRSLGLKTEQDYDISVSLSLPRSPANIAAGNFMLELELASAGGSSYVSASPPSSDAIAAAARLPPPNPREFLAANGRSIVYAAARPALLAYTDPLVATAARLVFLPYHLLAPAAAPESARLVVPMAEKLSFGSADVLPAVLYVEVRATSASDAGHQQQQLQTYSAEIVFAARLRGLRWFMYHHSIASFLILTAAFWLVEVLFMAGAFATLASFLSGPGDGEGGSGSGDYGDAPPASRRFKTEDDENTPDDSSLIKKESLEEEGAGGRALGRSFLASVPVAPSGSGSGEDSTNSSKDKNEGRSHSEDDNTDDDEDADNGLEGGKSAQEAILQEMQREAQQQRQAAAEAEARTAATTTGSLAAAIAAGTTESSLRQRQQQSSA